MDEMTIEKAVVTDAALILGLVNELAQQQIMLPRAPASVIENIRDFVIARVDGRFAGCGALHVVWSDLAEIRSIAVDPSLRQHGLGRRMAERLIEEAGELGIAKLFAFTYVPGFFEKLGFQVVEHASLPHKVFGDCMNCPKFMSCDEIAMVRVLRPAAEVAEGGLLEPAGRAMPLPSFPQRVPGMELRQKARGG